jgi:hypothetical protein
MTSLVGILAPTILIRFFLSLTHSAPKILNACRRAKGEEATGVGAHRWVDAPTVEQLLSGALPHMDLGAAMRGSIGSATSSDGGLLPAQRPVKWWPPWRVPG